MTQLLTKERIQKYEVLLERGLCKGKGSPHGQMCIESLISQVLDLPFSDDNSHCVETQIQTFKISLNDKNWSSAQARAKGLKKLGIAQLGSAGIVNGQDFLNKLQIKIIQVLIVDLYRVYFPLISPELVNLCEKEPTINNCRKLAYASAAAYAAAYSASAAAYSSAASAAYAAAAASAAAAAVDKYLIMCADLALEVLIELKSPGCEYLKELSE